jgi:hypothetical protein
MSVKFVRAPNSPVLIGAGIVLLLLGLRSAVAAADHFPMPVVVTSFIGDAVLGTALLFVVLRRSQFAGATAIIVGTFLTFDIVLGHVASLVFGTPARVTWWTAAYLAIAAAVVGPSLFPWSRTANKPAFFLIGLTFATLTLLVGSLAVLARL